MLRRAVMEYLLVMVMAKEEKALYVNGLSCLKCFARGVNVAVYCYCDSATLEILAKIMLKEKKTLQKMQ
jgi:hypothetical protein